MKNILVILFLFVSNSVFAQKIYTRNDSIPITQDSIIINAASHRGNIQWQKSFDNKNWINIVGKTADSIKIKPDENAMYRARIAEGTCVPVFSDSVAIITADSIPKNYVNPSKTGLILVSDSTSTNSDFEIGKIIVDEQSGGTIRRITDIIRNTDTVSVKTDQATMEDLFQNISFKLSTEMVTPQLKSGKLNNAQLSKALTDNQGFIHPFEVIDHKTSPVSKKSALTRLDNGRNVKLNYDFSGKKLYDKDGLELYISEGYFNLDADIKCDFHFQSLEFDLLNFKLTGGELQTFKFYTDETSTVNSKLILTAKASKEIVLDDVFVLENDVFDKYFTFFVGAVPVYMNVKMDIMAQRIANFNSELSVSAGFSSNHIVNVGASYDYGNWNLINNVTNDFQFQVPELDGHITFDAKVEVYPRVEIMFYSSLGPYFEIKPYLSENLVDNINGNFNFGIDTGIDANVGVQGNILGKQIFDFHKEFNILDEPVYKLPAKLSLQSGDNQNAEISKELPNPIIVKVTNSMDEPVENVNVNFSPISGIVESSIVKSDANGLAQTSWTLSTNTGEQSLEVYLLDGKDQKISDCSLYVNATATNVIINLPTITTNSITNIKQTSATSGGNITSDGGAAIIASGICWSKSQDPTTAINSTTDGNSSSFTSNLTGLTANTTYYVWAYAINSAGTGYGAQITFTTLPSVNTISITDITQNTASSGGYINIDGNALIIARGVCWSISQNPTIADSKTNDGTGIGSFTSSLTGLSVNTPNYVRAYATNNTGTGYGNQETLTTIAVTIETGTVTDIDGNVYQTVKIGDQWWMAENLKTTKYNDGTDIPNVTDASEWANLSTPGYCWYNNDVSNKNPYGALYNWFTVNTGKLAPIGWHVPTNTDWTTLTDFLGGESVAGSKLKEAGTMHWYISSHLGTNESGFTALPGGSHGYGGAFQGIEFAGYWWSSSEYNVDLAWLRALLDDWNNVYGDGNYKNYGYSVRCVRD